MAASGLAVPLVETAAGKIAVRALARLIIDKLKIEKTYAEDTVSDAFAAINVNPNIKYSELVKSAEYDEAVENIGLMLQVDSIKDALRGQARPRDPPGARTDAGSSKDNATKQANPSPTADHCEPVPKRARTDDRADASGSGETRFVHEVFNASRGALLNQSLVAGMQQTKGWFGVAMTARAVDTLKTSFELIDVVGESLGVLEKGQRAEDGTIRQLEELDRDPDHEKLHAVPQMTGEQWQVLLHAVLKVHMNAKATEFAFRVVYNTPGANSDTLQQCAHVMGEAKLRRDCRRDQGEQLDLDKALSISMRALGQMSKGADEPGWSLAPELQHYARRKDAARGPGLGGPNKGKSAGRRQPQGRGFGTKDGHPSRRRPKRRAGNRDGARRPAAPASGPAGPRPRGRQVVGDQAPSAISRGPPSGRGPTPENSSSAGAHPRD